MPSFRGVELSIVAGSEAKKLPEYPHPDGSSVRLMRVGPGLDDLRNRGCTSPSCSDGDPTRQKKVNPRVSVYFWLRYNVNHSSPPSKFVFFKMFMNGHHTVSWGIDTSRCSLGNVTRTLYEPGNRWADKNGCSGLGALVGIESRYFHFMPGLDKQSVAEDGGLIEVHVFRCRGRKRIAITLDPYPQRNQERYGIASPSGGLVDNPEDATYYEYHLDDAKDAPYATFCFHYRSMRHLEQLNLVPHHESKLRSRPMDARDTAVSCSQDTHDLKDSSPSPRQFAFGVESLDTQIFDNDVETFSVAASEPPDDPGLEEYFLKSPPELSPTRQSLAPTHDHQRALRDKFAADILQRPLPELPKSHSRQTSKESLRSNCPSLTPSLKLYVESEEFENEEIKVSTAHPLFIPSESMQALELDGMDTREPEGDSFSDYAASPTPSDISLSPELPSPEGYIPTTGSVLERHLNQFDSPIAQSSPKAKARLPVSKSEGTLVGDKETSTLQLTEAEWLRHTPSPTRRRSKMFGRQWSPRLEKRPGDSSLTELVEAEEGDGQNVERPDKNLTRDDFSGAKVKYVNEVPVGNWI
ncbi:hypothetical protein F4779DRAFT_631321 [Xylariaceae sp. FL0662B]|nr:hypothetical protein F4779DRAFT_631321 [Xylariaceae sp. FL0662B]